MGHTRYVEIIQITNKYDIIINHIYHRYDYIIFLRQHKMYKNKISFIFHRSSGESGDPKEADPNYIFVLVKVGDEGAELRCSASGSPLPPIIFKSRDPKQDDPNYIFVFVKVGDEGAELRCPASGSPLLQIIWREWRS